MVDSDGIELLNVRTLLSSERYVVPMYQRNYAWEETEIIELLRDVLDFAREARDRTGDGDTQSYYIGTLVVHRDSVESGGAYELIDGQQRLTTLSLLAAYMGNNFASYGNWPSVPNLEFQSRKASHRQLVAIFKNEVSPMGAGSAGGADNSGASAVLGGYHIIARYLPTLLIEYGFGSARVGEFGNYLMNDVKILRVLVPKDTDLNHYFEIMNSRGEQLEKHEILKARLLEGLDVRPESQLRYQSQAALHKVWEACSNMDRYVQTAFAVDERNAIFDYQWSTITATNFDEFLVQLASVEAGREKIKREKDKSRGEPFARSLQDRLKPTGNGGQKLDAIIALPEVPGKVAMNEQEFERFQSVVNFPNFLLQVLRVSVANGALGYEGDVADSDIPLDDKRLLAIFDKALLKRPFESEEARAAAISRFVFQLFRCRYLLDHFVIKREHRPNSEAWSLQKYRKSENGKGDCISTFGDERSNKRNFLNRRVLMLLAAFHVSAPTQAYKYWVYAALRWLTKNDGPVGVDAGVAKGYLEHMESVANAFVFDRYLSEPSAEYDEIIDQRGGACRTAFDESVGGRIRDRLRYGEVKSNLVFNYLDYRLWVQNSDRRSTSAFDSDTDDFKFTFRSSVEHLHPQTPLAGIEKWEGDYLDSFGNLCLISHSKNSKLGNNTPLAKRDYYLQSGIDSLKQKCMFDRMSTDGVWSRQSMRQHESEMLDILVSSLKPSPASAAADAEPAV